MNHGLGFPAETQIELEWSRRKFPEKINTLHEGYAILLEEMDELKSEVFAQRSARSPSRIWTELTQIAAMAQRMAEECDANK